MAQHPDFAQTNYCDFQWRLTPHPTPLRYIDNEFTQLMKGLQGERLRQAFKYLDTNLDGFILPDQFKRIILVSPSFLFQ